MTHVLLDRIIRIITAFSHENVHLHKTEQQKMHIIKSHNSQFYDIK